MGTSFEMQGFGDDGGIILASPLYHESAQKWLYILILSYFSCFEQTLCSRIHFRNCRIDSAYVSIKATLEDHVVVAEGSVIEPTVSIGRYTYMQAGCNINNCNMGRYCSLGNNVLIGPWQHPLNRLSTNPKIYRNILIWGGVGFDDLPPKTVIGNDVWIGSNAIVLGGVKIGNGAVIGAGSLVTKDVPDFAIVVGNPARMIRYRFSELNRKKISKLSWWEWTEAEMRNNLEEFKEERE